MNLHLSEAAYLWIFAFVFVIHLTEEFLGGTLSDDPNKLRGFDLSRRGFLKTNLVGIIVMILLNLLALRMGFPQFLLASFGTLVILNGVRHTIKSVKEVTYSPGLVTGLVFFLPLGAVTLLRIEPTMSGVRFGSAMATGLSLQIGASLVAHRGRQFFRLVKQGTRR
jgi:Protein of unknown function with HXXEE motif